MFKLVICDFGDVIAHFDIAHFVKFANTNGLDGSLIDGHFKRKKSDFDMAKINEQTFWSELARILQTDMDWRILASNNKKNMMVDFRFWNMLQKIEIPKILLSNMDPTTTAQIRSELDLSIFKQVVFSFEIKRGKMEVISELIETQNCRPEECIFIDDLQANIDVAKKIGCYVIRHITTEKTMLELLQMKIIT